MAKISQESLRGEVVVIYVASFLPPLTHMGKRMFTRSIRALTDPLCLPLPLASLTHRILGLPLRGMYNLGMISDKALQAVVMWLNGRYSAAAAALLLGRTPSPAAAPATTNPTNPDPGRPQGRPTRKHSRLYSPPSSPQANP